MKTQISGIMAMLFFAAFGMASPSSAENNTSEKLSKKDKAIVSIAAFTANSDIPRLKNALQQGLDDGLTVNEIKEMLVQIYAYAGFPKSLNGINTLTVVLDERKAQGKVDVQGKEATPLPADYDANAYGHKTRNTLVKRDMSKNSSAYAVAAPIIDVFLVEHLFGDIFARDVLTYQERELVTISTLAALPGVEAQLKAHLRIAINTGYTEAQLHDFVTVLKNNVGEQVADGAALALAETLGTPPSKPAKAIQVTKNTPPIPAPSEHFTGKVTVSSRFNSEATNNYGGGMVNFDAGARTAWHSHPVGQSLVIISGRGRVQSEGEEIIEVVPGDVVWIPADERHWHGAAPDAPMSHVAISERQAGKTVTWMEHVTDEQYGK